MYKRTRNGLLRAGKTNMEILRRAEMRHGGNYAYYRRKVGCLFEIQMFRGKNDQELSGTPNIITDELIEITHVK